MIAQGPLTTPSETSHASALAPSPDWRSNDRLAPLPEIGCQADSGLRRSAVRNGAVDRNRPVAGLSARAWDLGPPKGPVERLEHAGIGGDRRSMPDAPISSVIGNRRNAARQQCHGFRLPMRSGLGENALKVAAYGGKPDAHVCGNVLK